MKKANNQRSHFKRYANVYCLNRSLKSCKLFKAKSFPVQNSLRLLK